MANIGIRFQNETYIDTLTPEHFFQCSYERGVYNIVVLCDNSELLSHFTVSNVYQSKWIDLQRNRNYIKLTMKENCGHDSRNARLVFTHNVDNTAQFTLDIEQEARAYPISANFNEITFDSLLDQEDPESTGVTVTVIAEGGLEDFGIKVVKEFVKPSGSMEYREVPYDSGLYLKKLSNDRLLVKNFGQIAMYSNVYYILTLFHKNDRKSTCDIKVMYDDFHNDGISFDDNE